MFHKKIRKIVTIEGMMCNHCKNKEESSLKEKYYKVKPTMTEEKQKTVDNLFEQLSPSLKKQGQLNDLKKLILKIL